MLLRHYLEQGMSKAALAEKLGLSRRTIYHWIQSGQLDRDVDAEVCYRARPGVVTKLEPYKPIVRTRLEGYPELSGVRLFAEIRAAGYTGGYSQLTEFLRRERPRKVAEPVQRFETPAGHQAQVDFARFVFPWAVRYALLVVLGYSRLLWLRFYARQDLRTLILGLEEAFAFFGGVPHELLFDQMKAVITRDLRLLGGQLVHNLEFLRFCRHWEFTARACRPYRAQTKGKVERPVRYVRDNFIYGRDFAGDGDLDAQRLHWLEQVANVRVHQTIKEQPIVRFELAERAQLKPLAPQPYSSLILKTVPPPSEKKLAAPSVEVEQRSLRVYARLARGAR